jgi:eukaryotic-like serine/threonine-protein kinase
MSHARPANLEETIFAGARALSAAERAGHLDRACGTNHDLRRRLEELLSADDEARFMAGPAAGLAAIVLPLVAQVNDVENAGVQIGPYTLLQKIGEGGCGVVWMAEQDTPVRRRVALKVIKLGMDTKSVIARFDAERQALAMMDHPNIARVLDGGATDAGRPYFVMELVRGDRITSYCDEARLTTRERLDLFIKVCQAIQHAHQKGIIHRDIKPSNILVTINDGVAVPKVIDFGIAKATEGRLTDKTLVTQFAALIGTPAYMSPEQTDMTSADLDTRCDIYSLGVLLYELLAGATPFDTKELLAGGLEGMRKTIREQEPVRPSSRLATLQDEELATAANRRSVDRSKLRSQLQGDLDWIVMKCLEKDRARRYETANGLAADLRRHLNNEPVVARPPSAVYRYQKFLRRNKVMAGAVGLVLIAILAGTVISIGQALRARRELRRALAAEANAQVEKANALNEKANAQAALYFLQEDVLNQASPGNQPNRDLTVRTLLDNVAERLDRAGGRPPLVEASIRQTLGSVYKDLSEYTKAVRHYERALELHRQHLGESNADTLRSLHGLAMANWSSGNNARAETLARQGLEESRRVQGEKHPLTLQFMQVRATALQYSSGISWTELEPLFLEVLALHRELLGPDNLGTFRLIQDLGVSYNLNWQEAKAEPLIAEALDRAHRVLGEKHPQTSNLSMVMDYTYANLNQLEKAELPALRNVEVRRRLLGEKHIGTIVSLILLARVHVQQQQFDQAEPLTARVLDLSRLLPIENTNVMPWKLSLLSEEYLEQGRVGQADALCEVALEVMRRKPGANPRANPRVITQMGAVRLAQRKYPEAEALLRESLPLVEKQWADAAFRFYVMSLLGASVSGQDKYAEAEPLLVQGFQGLQRRQANIPPYLNATRRITESLERLVQLYDAWGKPTQAAEWRTKLAEFEQGGKAAEKKSPQR